MNDFSLLEVKGTVVSMPRDIITQDQKKRKVFNLKVSTKYYEHIYTVQLFDKAAEIELSKNDRVHITNAEFFIKTTDSIEHILRIKDERFIDTLADYDRGLMPADEL